MVSTSSVRPFYRSFAIPSFAVSLLLQACSPHKVTHNPAPPIELPESFSQIDAGATNLPEKWWLDFQDPQLNALVERALRENLEIRAAWERVSQAKAVVTQAKAPRFPFIGINSGVAITQPANRFVPSSPLSIEASYELDLFNKYGNGGAAAHLDAEAARDQLEASAMSLVAQISDTWFALVAQRAQARLLQEQIDVSKNFLELAEMRLAQGLGSALDVLQQRRQLAQVKSQAPVIDAGAAVLQNQLAILTGQSPSAIEVAVAEALPALPPLPSAGVPADLLLRRPDVRAARRRVEAADHRVAIAVAQRLPSLRLSGSYGPFQRVNTDFALGSFGAIAGSLLMPLFEGGRLKAEVKRSEAVVRERSYQFGQALLLAMAEVENALIQERKQVEYVVLLEDQLRIANDTLEEARRRYSDGIGEQSFLQILTALSAVQQIEQNLIQAQQQALSYRVQLCRALGGTWSRELSRKGKTEPTAAAAK